MHATRLLCVSALAAAAHAQSLISDINTLGSNPSSSPTGGVRAGAFAYFVADDGVSGRELWRTDGTAVGTILLRDIAPGSATSSPDLLTPVGNALFFTANDPASGPELWVTDGTAPGTHLVIDLEPGVAGSNPLSLTAVGNALWFTATYGDAVTGRGRELYRTDGTAAGTVLVADVRPGPLSGLGSDATLAPLGGVVLFPANDGVNGRELWSSGGTAATTTLVADIHPTGSSNPGSLCAAGSHVFFTANDGVGGVELWRTDGTFATTVQVADVRPGANGSAPAALTALGSTVLFTADDGTSGREPWRSDGTAAGTLRLVDLNLGAGSSSITRFAVAGSYGWTLGLDVNGQNILLRTDGSAAGTQAVITTYQYLHDVTSAGTGIVFGAVLDVAGDEPWFASATTAPFRLFDVNPGSVPSNPIAFATLGASLCFAGFRADVGFELFTGPLAGGAANLLADISPQRASTTSDPASAVNFLDRVWFTADDGVHGRELWVADATAGPAALFLDINPWGGANPRSLTVVDDKLYFVADDGVNGTELWTTDGTPSGTQMVADINPGYDGSYAWDLTPLNGQLIFRAIDSPAFMNNLYVTDGTASGTQRVYDFASGGGSAIGPFVASGPRVFFPAYSPATGYELWVSDTSTAGTHMVVDLTPGTASGWPQIVLDRPMVAWNGGVLFNGATPASGIELWFTDGTAANTTQVAEIAPGNSSGFSGGLTACGNCVYFVGYDAYSGAGYGVALWRTDGTTAGTWLVPGQPANCQPANLCALGNVLLFECWYNIVGRELWRTDGTAGGTFQVSDVGPGGLSGVFANVARIGHSGVAVFTAGLAANQLEAWRTDGTLNGTWALPPIPHFGPNATNPNNFVADGITMFCALDNGQLGREPWRIPLSQFGAAAVEGVGIGCPGTAGRRPRAGTYGLPQPGAAQFAIEVGNAAPNAAAFLLLNLGGTIAQPVGGGCTEYVPLPAVTALVLTSGLGTGAYPFPLPNTAAYQGLDLCSQFWVLDPAGSYQSFAALSNGLRILLGQ